MNVLITIYSEGPDVTGFILSEPGWEFLRTGDRAIALMDDALHRAIEFLEDMPSEREHVKIPTAPHEQTCLPTPRPYPHYYEVMPGVDLASIIGAWPGNMFNAAKYLFRAGKKPGNRAQDDLAKAVDYLLYEIARLDALDRQRC